MISEKALKQEVKKAKQAVKALKANNKSSVPAHGQFLNFLLLCRAEVELQTMEELLNYKPEK